MKHSIRIIFLCAFLFGAGLLSSCNLITPNEALCQADLKNYDECFTILLITNPDCVSVPVAAPNTCGPSAVQTAKEICHSRIKFKSCRAYRD
ncbi:hypothetical protein CH373_00440 [Leptospira perolatii]|uniref:Lipoprotein n=1 Tax=Leptospira perolatii TaxID=2023191 RepID=A0A2M9ZR55_9LEPT|nr:hypothetical protein CH360_00440 [Leptospira perolatii]PJZ74567.1 hypothetical protein CH373_00440 [Leptospira perolatii]